MKRDGQGIAIQNLSKSKVLVIGDLILDIYHRGDILGVSAETPTLVVHDEFSKDSWGGAGLLVRNILALGGHATFLTLLGDDEYAIRVSAFKHENLRNIFLKDRHRKTTVKERFWVKNHKLLCWDRLDNRPISLKLEKSILNFVKKNLDSFDKLVISDYRHGLLTERLAQQLVSFGKKRRKPVYVDSQVSQNIGNHKWYRGAKLICLNEREAMSVDSEFNDQKLRNSLRRLAKILRAPNIVLKLGERGSASFIGDKYIQTGPYRVKAVDTAGAGDAFFAILVLVPGQLGGVALKIANTWAALSTTIVGTEPPSFKTLEVALRT